MPPDPTNAIEHSDLVVYDSSSESEFEEDEDPLPPPVDVDTPFEFDRIAERLQRSLELDPDIGQMEMWEDENGMLSYTIELRRSASGMRKIISSSGDVHYQRRSWTLDDRLAEAFWHGTEAGVCESCQHASGLGHPVWYKQSDRMYQEIDYGEDRVLASLPDYAWSYRRNSVQCDVRTLRPLNVFMQHNALPTTLGDAVRRQKLHADMMWDIADKDAAFLTDTLAAHGMEMPSSVRRMKQKDQVMRDLFCSCVCGQGTRKARVWTLRRQHGSPLYAITKLDVSEAVIRERWAEHIGEDDRPLFSEVRFVEQECACLCACGHRNTNYVPMPGITGRSTRIPTHPLGWLPYRPSACYPPSQ